MAKTVWPTEAELTDFLEGLGVDTIPTGVTLQDEIDGAVAACERATGRTFIDAAATTKKYSPDASGFVDFGGEFVSVTSVSVDGSTLVLDSDYWLFPDSSPYSSMKMATWLAGDPQSISVVGTWGYGAAIPLPVWNGVLRLAAASVYRFAAATGAVPIGPVTKVKAETTEVQYGGGGSSSKSFADELEDMASSAFRSYARLGIGGA